jgi:autotransporter-associated beta strand protein
VLAFNRTDAVTFGGVVSGSGSLTQAGTGTLILTGANTYSGGTTISAGTLQIGNGGTTGSIIGNVLDNGVLAFNRSDNITFAGNISGSGSVLLMGTGTVALTGANTYSGGTAIGGGASSSRLRCRAGRSRRQPDAERRHTPGHRKFHHRPADHPGCRRRHL